MNHIRGMLKVELFLWSICFIKIRQLNKIFHIVMLNRFKIGNFFVILIGHKLVTWVEDEYQTRKIPVKVRCVFPIATWSTFRAGQYRDDHRKAHTTLFYGKTTNFWTDLIQRGNSGSTDWKIISQSEWMTSSLVSWARKRDFIQKTARRAISRWVDFKKR